MRFDIASFSVVPHSEKLDRAREKRDLVLRFLSGGEVYLTVDVAGDLLNVSRSVALTTLNTLESQRCLKSEVLLVPDDSGQPRTTKIFGITSHGLAMAGAEVNSLVFELGRTKSLWVPHHRSCQIVRLAAERAGWTGWTSERALREGTTKLKKIPDAIATSPSGLKVAIEVERHVKTVKRYEDIQWLYLADLKSGKVDRVVYICPTRIAPAIQRIFRNLSKKVIIFDYPGWPHTPMQRLKTNNNDIDEEDCEHPVIPSE